MYRVLYNDALLFDPYVEETAITDAKLTQEVNSSAYFDFTISPKHPLYDTVAEREGAVKLYYDAEKLFEGEITKIETDIYGYKAITCVSALDYLNDTCVRPYSTVKSEGLDLVPPSSVNGYFQWLIDQHNEHVLDASKTFTVGVNQGEYFTGGAFIYRSSESYSSTADEIQSNILDVFGGYLFLRYDGENAVLDLYSDVHEANTQIIDFGVNITDFSKILDTDEQYTALIVQGGSPEFQNGGFEDGTFIEWASYARGNISSDQVHSGSYSAYFTEGGNYINDTGFYFKTGARYKSTIWVKNERDADIIVTGAYQYETTSDGWKTKTVSGASLSVPNDGEWHEFTFDFLPDVQPQTKIRPVWSFGSLAVESNHRVYVDDAEFTRLDGEDSVSEDPLDLSHIPDGVTSYDSDIVKKGDVLYSTSYVQRYGYKEKVYSDDTITDEQKLLEEGIKQLRKLMAPVVTIDVKAVDLSLYIQGYTHLRIGEAVRVRSAVHDVDEYLMVSSIDLDLQDPGQTDYTLGTSYDTLTGQQSGYLKSLNAGINHSLDSVASLDQSVKDQAIVIGSVQEVANDAKDTANNAQNTANSAQQAAQDAQNSASSALDKAEAAEGAVNEIQGMIDDINSGTEQAKQDAAQAKADAQQAAAKADAASQAAQAAANKADALEGSITDVTTTVDGVVQDIEEITTSVTGAISTANEALSAASSASQDLEGFKTTVSQTYQLKGDYATNTDLDEAIAEEVLNRNSAIEQSASSITSTVSQTYATKTDLAVTDGKAAQAQSAAQQAQTSASNAQSTANAANNAANGVAEDLTDYMETVATTYASKSELEQTSESITATVEANYTEVKQLANTAQSTADSALSKANEASGELADFTESVTGDLADLQDQIDGNIATWFYAGTPTLTNEPAVNWTTTEEKNQHLGDLYYDTNNGYAWRFMVQNGSYSWGRITDSDVTKALEDAANAQDTADSKRRVFVSQPTPPYDVGDLWVQGENGDILRCATARASGSYNASDWVLASKYTDDSALEIFEGQVADIYSTKAELETATDAITATVEENFEKSVLVKEADGGVIDCGETAGMPLAGLTVYGQTRQNLWANPSYESSTINGITYSNNSNGTMTFSGTATANRTISSERKYILKPGTQYTVQVDRKLADTYVAGNADGACFFVRYSTSEGAYISDVTFGYGTLLRVTFTTPSNLGYCTFNINIAQGTTVSGTYRVMLNEGSEPQSWCPPGLNSVESLEIVTAGKNLGTFAKLIENDGSLSNRGITSELVKGGGIRVHGTATGGTAMVSFGIVALPPGLEVTLSMGSQDSGVVLRWTDTIYGFEFTTGSPKTFISKDTGKGAFVIAVNDGTTVDTIVYPQLELGSTATAYEPPAVTTTPIPLLGNKISSIPDGTRDELVVDAGGNVVLRKKTHQQVIVGDDLLYRYTSNTVWITLFNNPILDYEHPYHASLSIEDNAAFSDKIPYYPIGNTGALPVFYTSRIGISTTSQNAPQAVYVNTPLNTTVAEAKEWLNDNPVQFLYALKDPYDIPLGTVDLPDLPETNAHVWVSTSTQGLDPDIHATWYGENASALKNFASKAELKVESDQIKATVEETYSTKEEVSAVEDKANAAQDALDSYKETVSTTYATKSEVTQTANSIKQEVSETYTTKADASATYATKTSLSTVEQTVNGLKSTVSSNYTTLSNKFGSYYTKTEVDQKDSSIKSTVSSVQTTANNALEKASTVEQTADGLTVRLTQAEKDVDTAQSTANTAKTNAATAQSTANTANSTANTAKTNAATAQNTANAAQNAAEAAQSTANTAKTAAATAQTTATNAAKTATNYLKFDSSGLCVGNMTASTLSYNTLIKSTGVDIRNGTTVLATYGSSAIELGKNSKTSVIQFSNNQGFLRATGTRAIQIGSGTPSSVGGTLSLEDSDGAALFNGRMIGKCGSYNYEMYAGRVIFSGAATTGNVTLLESAANFDYITIFVRTNDNYYGSTTVWAPNGKNVALSVAFTNNASAGGAGMYVKTRTVSISGTAIANVNYGYGTTRHDTYCTAAYGNSYIYIYQVVGYK